MKRFSVVIPIYKVEKYLRQCIDSVLAQTITDYEIILVDDGSPDNCGKICDEYAEKYENVYAYHKENGGLSDSRNFGTLKATGEYILYLDSDDYYGNNDLFLEMEKVIKEKNPTAIAFPMTSFSAETGEVYKKNNHIYDVEHLNNLPYLKEKLEYLIQNNQLMISACGYAFKREFITENELFFEKGLLGEDIERSMRLFLNEFELWFLNVPAYFARRGRVGSITSTIGEKNVKDLYYTVSKHSQIFKNSNLPCAKVLLNYMAYQYSILCSLLVRLSDRQQKKQMVDKLMDYKWLLDYDLSPKVKKVKKYTKIFGLKITIKILGFYLKYRKKK